MQAVQHAPQQSTPEQPVHVSRSPIGVPSASCPAGTTQQSGPAQQTPPQLQYPPAQQKPSSPVAGSGGQETPQRPQDSQTPSPSQSTIPAGQTHWLLTHLLLPGQTAGSQSGSCWTSQRMLQASCGAHPPGPQVPLAQRLPQLPQWYGSRVRSTHSGAGDPPNTPQRVSPPEHWHVPLTHAVPSMLLQ